MAMSLRIRHWCFLCLLTLMVSGCGFHLRGSYSVSDELSHVSIVSESVSPAMVRAVTQAMTLNGVEVLPEADIQLLLKNQSDIRRTVSLTRLARSSEYELRTVIHLSVVDRDGNELLPERTLYAERVYSIDPDNITATETQEIILKEQIRRELAQQIMRQYIRLKSS
ncbi:MULTISPECIES: LPS-assembly lipoprotein LptE [Nitrincola]|uniref:LPS-assembly lipoprotein LptE n=1 Tax=Nitrincola nitratireducens TaxID=1229521 RepID=W9UQ94_9GAMM|nr:MULTISPECIES: LPS assembly lipoprotein LptE [Nitrincola]EXJ09378.1 Rare lipoprotein B [Nitrincola nitratireducens]